MRLAYLLVVILLVALGWFLVYAYSFLMKLSKAISFTDGPELFWSWVTVTILFSMFKSLANSK